MKRTRAAMNDGQCGRILLFEAAVCLSLSRTEHTGQPDGGAGGGMGYRGGLGRG